MKAIDLFAGCGGLSLGLSNSGIDIAAAYEYWEPALKVYRNNFEDHPIFHFDLQKVNDAIEHITKFKPDLIAGGPPCQDFSSAGKRDETGSRADLSVSFCDIVIGVKPKWFLMENVDRIEKSNVLKKIKNSLQNAGYGLTSVVLDASYCNVPQKRKRFFLIGKLGEVNGFILPNILNGLSTNRLSVREYFNDKLGTEFYYRHPRSYARRGIFSIDEPSPTIRGVNRPIPPGYSFHSGDPCHDLMKIRPLSTIERAQIQTFPKDFKWLGNKSTIEQLIGNAVPVNLAEFVGSNIINFENKKGSYDFKEIEEITLTK